MAILIKSARRAAAVLTLVVVAVPAAQAQTATQTVTWAVTTNQTGAKITASIETDMPAGLTLSASLAALGGGILTHRTRPMPSSRLQQGHNSRP